MESLGVDSNGEERKEEEEAGATRTKGECEVKNKSARSSPIYSRSKEILTVQKMIVCTAHDLAVHVANMESNRRRPLCM